MVATAQPTQRRPVTRMHPWRDTGIAHYNVGETERWLSMAGGGALAIYGLTRGDVLGLLAAAAGGALVWRGATGHCDVYETLGVNTARPHSPQASIPATHGLKVEQSVTVLRPRAELYQFWRNFENLPRVMRHVESVECQGDNRTHWVAKGPMGTRVEWDAEVITEKENELIGWRSLEGSEVDTAGSVHFLPAPGDRGTEVKVVLKYDPPAGKTGAALAWLFGKSAAQEIRSDLQRFKALMETGAVPTTEGQPRGRCS